MKAKWLSNRSVRKCYGRNG